MVELILQVRCIETKVAAYITDSSRRPPKPGASTTPVGNILEIKDAYLPPWIVCNLCEIIGSQGSFEARYVMLDGFTSYKALTFSNKSTAAIVHQYTAT